jgi:hypothetical protein
MLSFRLWANERVWLPFLTLIAFTGLMLPSCENSEGLGGTGSISGTITERFYNDDFSDFLYQAAAVDEEVFIVFGEDDLVGERVNTGVTGEFRFNYLYPGRYYIYYRTDDSTAIPDDGWSEKLEVDLDRGGDVDLGELVKINTLNYDDGAAVIRGVVKKIKYDKDSYWPNLVVEYIDYAHEQEVYLTYGDHEFYDERVRTQYDGSFEFRKLIPGDYLVFLYSEDVTRVTEHVVLKYEVTITEFDQVVDLDEITIEAI